MFHLPQPKHTVSVNPSIVVFTVFLLLGLYFLYYIRSILVLLLLAFIIVAALDPFVDTLQRRVKLPRVASVLVVYLITFGLLGGLLALVIPPLANELYQLVRAFEVPASIEAEIRDLRFTVNELGNLAERIGTSVSMLFNVVTSTFSGILALFTLIVISVYMMLDRPRMHMKVAWFSREEKHLELAKRFLDSVEVQLGSWVRGQAILMLTIGVVTYIGLSLLSIPYALPLAIVAGLLEVLPNIGPTVAAIPAIIFAFIFISPLMAGVTTLFYILVQQLENNILVPKIMRDNADVNPLVSIVTILIGLKMAGFLGALLAIPAYIILRTAYSFWYNSQK